MSEKLNFSFHQDQQKFKSLPEDKKETIVEDAHNEAIKIKQKAEARAQETGEQTGNKHYKKALDEEREETWGDEVKNEKKKLEKEYEQVSFSGLTNEFTLYTEGVIIDVKTDLREGFQYFKSFGIPRSGKGKSHYRARLLDFFYTVQLTNGKIINLEMSGVEGSKGRALTDNTIKKLIEEEKAKVINKKIKVVANKSIKEEEKKWRINRFDNYPFFK
jgi:vacuolar-type H+-ATPase subunit H